MPYLGNGLSKFTTADDLTVSGDATIDTTTLVVDSTNNRVGVKVAPERDLHVKGSSGDPVHFKLEGDASDYARIMFDDGTTDNIGELRYNFGSDYMSFNTNSAERMRLLSNGKLVLGGTAHDYSGNFGLQIDASGSDNANIIFRTASDAETFIVGADQALDAGVLNVLSNDPMVFKTNDTERVRIDNTGRVSITPDGTAVYGESSADNLTIYQTGANVGMTIRSDSNRPCGIYFADGTTGNQQYMGYIEYNHNTDLFSVWGEGALRFGAGGSEKARFDSNGRLLIGTTSAFENAGITAGANGTSSSVGHFNRAASGSAAGVVRFYGSGSEVGSVQVTTSAATYTSASDRRLKSNIKDAASASDKIDAIQVRQFDWNVDGSHQDYGLIAQELEAIEPLAVTGDADSDEMMGVDYSKLVPMLIKEIQELRSRVAALEE